MACFVYYSIQIWYLWICLTSKKLCTSMSMRTSVKVSCLFEDVVYLKKKNGNYLNYYVRNKYFMWNMYFSNLHVSCWTVFLSRSFVISVVFLTVPYKREVWLTYKKTVLTHHFSLNVLFQARQMPVVIK